MPSVHVRLWVQKIGKAHAQAMAFTYTMMCACLLSWCHMLSSLDHCFFIILAW